MPRQTRLAFVVFCSSYRPTHPQQLFSRDRLAGPRSFPSAPRTPWQRKTGSHILRELVELVAVVVHERWPTSAKNVMQLHREAGSGN